MGVLGSYIDPREKDEVIFDDGIYPLLNAMAESLQIPHFIDSQCGSLDPRLLLSPGQLAKALIINVLAGREPIYKVYEAFENVDCEVIFGSGILAEDLTEARLGSALDTISELNQQQLFSQIALRAMHIHGISTDNIHVDTTNFSLFGEYDQEAHNVFNATSCGAPKSGKKNLKAVALGTAVGDNKIPFLFQALSGNSSDAVWFRDALTEITTLFSGDLHSRPILTFDAAGSNQKMFKMAAEAKAPCIIRLSRTFKNAGDSIERAWAENRWQKVGKLSDRKKGSFYSVCSFDFDSFPGWRLTVVHSTSLEDTKRKTMERALPKKKETIEKRAASLAKESFKTLRDAEEAASKFIMKNINPNNPFNYEVDIDTEVIEKYARPGRPTPDTPKVKITSYKVKFILGDLNMELFDSWLRDQSCFVLVDNVPTTRLSGEDVLKRYKKQWKVEDVFRFIKDPLDFGPLWLDTPRRIQSLLFLISLAVLTASFLLFRLHKTLSGNPCGKDDPESIPKKFQDVTGRKVSRPTFNMVREHLAKLKVVVYNDPETNNWIRKFQQQTRHRWLQIIVDIGFDPEIYLKPYSTVFDLWDYKSG